jgi:hypothetical protein
LRGDALIALGRLEPLLDQAQAPHPWQTLWQTYGAHALCLAGRTDEALALALVTVPVDAYVALAICGQFRMTLWQDDAAELTAKGVPTKSLERRGPPRP